MTSPLDDSLVMPPSPQLLYYTLKAGALREGDHLRGAYLSMRILQNNTLKKIFAIFASKTTRPYLHAHTCHIPATQPHLPPKYWTIIVYKRVPMGAGPSPPQRHRLAGGCWACPTQPCSGLARRSQGAARCASSLFPRGLHYVPPPLGVTNQPSDHLLSRRAPGCEVGWLSPQ